MSTPENCLPFNTEKNKHTKKTVIYGLYKKTENQLIVNAPVILELSRGRKLSKAINCQHKSLYAQAIATLVHELTHAYDLNNGRISNSEDYMRRVSLKQSLLIKNKNLLPIRSSDIFEMTNLSESFAVNMEYFVMDPEFYCHKPSMFNYFKNLFGADPYPQRNCSVSNTVMVSSLLGVLPIELDPHRIYRIDYLLPTSMKEIPVGVRHSMFRIVICAPTRIDPISNMTIPATPMGKKCLEDLAYHLVINYKDNSEDSKLDLLKNLNLWGAYPTALSIFNFSEVLEKYNRDEHFDLTDYPLKLSETEKKDFILRVKEEHWNYRRSYNFISNNCTEDNNHLDDRSSLITKKAVLEDLNTPEYAYLLDMESAEVFSGNNMQLFIAFKEAYGHSSVSNKENIDQSAWLKFINESSSDSRMARFKIFSQAHVPNHNLNANLTSLKKRLAIASSFSVMEQYFQRTLILKIKTEAAEYFYNENDSHGKDILKELHSALSLKLNDSMKIGYGIPSNDEIIPDAPNEKNETLSELSARAQNLLKETFPNDFNNLEKISESIKIYNEYSLNARSKYRTKLELYVNQVINNLSHEESTRMILIDVIKGNKPNAIKRVRNLLGADLVTNRDLLDVKLKKIIKNNL